MDLDLTEAIEAAREEMALLHLGEEDDRRYIADAAVRAAAPIIERAVRERVGGICGNPAPTLTLRPDGEEHSTVGMICELAHGHASEWHEAPSILGPLLLPMRWTETSRTISGTFDA